MDFGNLRMILEIFFKAIPMVRSLYTLADMEKDISITSNALDRYQSVRGNFGVDSQGQSSSVVKSDVKLYVKYICEICEIEIEERTS